MAEDIKRVALSTGGGDAPGLNAVIRAATLAARNRGLGRRRHPRRLQRADATRRTTRTAASSTSPAESVRGIVHQGGTIIGTTNRGNPTAYPVQQDDGTWIEIDRTEELVGLFKAHEIDALITVGGDGSLTIANRLHEAGLRVIGVPKTIDNDLDKTTSTFGFDTAVSFASECIDRLFSTATSHGRVIVVEVMGRYAGWIALCAGTASGAHAILIPEIPFELEPVAATIAQRERRGAKFSIVVVAEGAVPVGGTVSVLGKAIGQAEKLGGIGETVAKGLEELTGKEARTVVLGHLLRGGTPTSFDRLLGLRFGAAAVRALEEGEDGVMVALDPPTVLYVPLAEATSRLKVVPLDCDTLLTARDMGINFGDAMPLPDMPGDWDLA